MSVAFTAPWGTLPADPTALQMLEFVSAQLRMYLAEDVSPNAAYTRAELAAYQEVLLTGLESNAQEFFRCKKAKRLAGQRVSNQDVIKHLKDKGIWK